ELVSPTGVSYANETTGGFLLVFAEPPIAPGAWTLRVSSATPARYEGRAGAAYLADAPTGDAVALTARVAAIAAAEGRAAITGRPTALVPLADLQAATGATGQATHAYYRVEGDPRAAAESLKEQLPEAQRQTVEVRAEKAIRIEEALETGAEITGFLLVMGGFTVLAAVLLAFTLFSALVEERRAELGIMRALGMTRGEVAVGMTIEGALYAFAAAVVGLALGVLILMGLLAGIDAVASARADLPFHFAMHVSPATLGIALAVGTLLPLATIGLASLRFARLDPARAIRGIPDDPKGRRRTGLVVALVLVALGALLSLADVPRLVGVPIALAGVGVALAAWGRPGLALVPAALGFAHVAWTLYTFVSFPEDAQELDPVMTLARGAVLALGAAALCVASAAPYRGLLRAATRRKGSRAPFVAVKYLVSRRRPVGLTIAMISVVVVVVTVMGTLFATFGATIPEDEAGYAVLGESPVREDAFPRALPADLAAKIAAAEFLPRHAEFRQANASSGGEELEVEFGLRQFLGVTPGFAERNEYELDPLAPQYATPLDAWRAVERGEAILMPDWALEEMGVGPGDTLRLETAITQPREYVVAGGVRSTFVFQTFLAAEHVRAMGFPQATQVYVRVAEGHDPDEVAHRLTDMFDDDGLRFTSVPEEVQAVAANAQALVLVFEAFLALGLFVGLAATGFLASRAVHERMRDIGTLRALGFEAKDVQRAFILESTLTAALGLLVGTLVGLLVAHSVWWREARDQGAPFSPPWLMLGLFSLAVLGLAAWASRGPAKRAAALPPAIAVRHVE
ncbi:MAG TPA: FtsX-like permease family protein, partial [Candidatus Thermoplasmatota archaeon]|nr:FtsX-like permease family protein [Candidatus Thermoplasmatota archaeon]